MLWLKIVSKFIKAFRSGESPGQIAAGFAVGSMIGLMPFWTIQGVFLFILLILLKINLAAGTVAILLGSLFAYLLDPLFHHIGFFMLVKIPALQSLWESFYNSVFGQLSRFNNTVAMGSFVCGIILFLPIFFAMKSFVIVYREKLESRVQKMRIVQAIKGSKLFKLYERIRDLGGE
ncbi:MAG: TIGR03546 family protein [bacterium]|nr:TIGR03546 family protein [bacterium]